MSQFVQCKQCMNTAMVPDGADPHTTMNCGCCPQDHHHGAEANACPRQHPGPCWQGPLSGPRPEGCTVCRPLLFLGNAVVTPAGLVVPDGLGGVN